MAHSNKSVWKDYRLRLTVWVLWEKWKDVEFLKKFQNDRVRNSVCDIVFSRYKAEIK